MTVETDENLTTRGSVSNPIETMVPARLAPWEDFIERQRITLGNLYPVFPVQAELFANRDYLRQVGEEFSTKKISSKKDLEYFQRVSVEGPVSSIPNQIVRNAGDEPGIGDEISFENHPNGISDVNEEVAERLVTQQPSTPTSHPGSNTNRLFPDQFCIRKREVGGLSQRHLVFVEVYKPPHKLTLPHLRSGLRPMDIRKDVINHMPKPNMEDPEAMSQYHADKLLAAAILQTFHCMMEGGLEYFLLTTGTAIVFLGINWSNLVVLYYHLADPGEEAHDHPDDFRYCTTVAQVLAFSLMALNSRTHTQDERRLAAARLTKWTVNDEAILPEMPPSIRAPLPQSPLFNPNTYTTASRSPIFLRRSRRNRATRADRPVRGGDRDRSPEDHARTPDAPTPAIPGSRGARRRASRARQPRQAGPRKGSSRQGGSATDTARRNAQYERFGTKAPA